MTITLSTEQAALWQEGGWSGFRIEEDVLEDLERQRITGVVAVMLPDGRMAFGITPQVYVRKNNR